MEKAGGSARSRFENRIDVSLMLTFCFDVEERLPVRRRRLKRDAGDITPVSVDAGRRRYDSSVLGPHDGGRAED